MWWHGSPIHLQLFTCVLREHGKTRCKQKRLGYRVMAVSRQSASNVGDTCLSLVCLCHHNRRGSVGLMMAGGRGTPQRMQARGLLNGLLAARVLHGQHNLAVIGPGECDRSANPTSKTLVEGAHLVVSCISSVPRRISAPYSTFHQVYQGLSQ